MSSEWGSVRRNGRCVKRAVLVGVRAPVLFSQMADQAALPALRLASALDAPRPELLHKKHTSEGETSACRVSSALENNEPVSIDSWRLQRRGLSDWVVDYLYETTSRTAVRTPVLPAFSLDPAVRFARWIGTLLTSGWRLARAHDLNPWVFIGMSAVGWAVQGMVYTPWFHGAGWRLALLILLRLIALVVPSSILLKGKKIALAFNTSIVLMFAANTTWHVCYYVFL